MKIFQLLPLSGALALAFVSGAQAQSLVELYNAAKGFDASYQSAKLQFDASLAKADQAAAAVLPSAALSLNATLANQIYSSALPDRQPGSMSATVVASKPLYRPANEATAEQGRKQVGLAKAQLNAAEQDLIIRVSQAYFDALAASDTLNLVRAQKEAVSQQLAAAKRNFEVGTATITDTREAQARYDLTLAQEISANNDLEVKTLVLSQLTGKAGAKPVALARPEGIGPINPPAMQAWVNKAEQEHPVVVQAQLALEVAQLETKKAQAGKKPTVDLEGTVSVSQNNEFVTSTHYWGNSASIGVKFNLPLYSGNALENRIKETLVLEDKARNDIEVARRAVAQATRSAFLGVQSGLGQISALQAAEVSGQSALDATKLGYQVGVRINIDVLNAQTALYDTKNKLAKARYDVLLGGLKLRQASGQLSAGDLISVTQLLAK